MPLSPWEREIGKAARDVARYQAVCRQLRARLRAAERAQRQAAGVLRRLVAAVSAQPDPGLRQSDADARDVTDD